MNECLELEQKLSILTQDSELLEKIGNCVSVEQLIDVCKENGVDLSEEDLLLIGETYKDEMKSDVEFREDELEEITGGLSLLSSTYGALKIIKYILSNSRNRSKLGGGQGSFGGGKIGGR